MLYRGRSGEEGFGRDEIMNAGAFSIQHLEGSRCGTFQLWVLNGGEDVDSRRKRESNAPGRHCAAGESVLFGPLSHRAGEADTRVASVLEYAVTS